MTSLLQFHPRFHSSRLALQYSHLRRVHRRKPNYRNCPFSIPELLYCLGGYLDVQTLLICIRVSKAWHFILLPWLYLEIEVQPSDTRQKPAFHVARKHSSLIRRLNINGHVNVSFRQYLTCPILSHLTIHQYRTCSSFSELIGKGDPYILFIQRHQKSLTYLSTNQATTTELLDTIAACPKLQELHLSKLKLASVEEWLSVYERIWSRLRALTIQGAWLASSPSSSDSNSNGDHQDNFAEVVKTLSRTESTAATAKIRDLTILGSDRDKPVALAGHLWLIKQCPDLAHLHWTTPNHDLESGPMHLLMQEVRAGSVAAASTAAGARRGSGQPQRWWWHTLESLSLRQRFLHQDFAVLVKAMTRFIKLDLASSNFDLDCWRILQASPHMRTLKVLNFESCLDLAGSAVQEMLCTMPQLEVFKAHALSDMDIRSDARPWVCSQSLRSLGLSFKLDSSPSISRPTILSRLASLENLEHLQLNNHAHPDPVLQLSLIEGLDQLGTLVRLKTFEQPVTVHWGSAEAEWVEENWPMLRSLKRVKLSREARALLRSLQIKY
ncbi:hypothetical protein BGZ83_002962 [Gryganskiella cystojenkinii]|nr:hypothetical protein BGZ83_002962 [Gryganskiella cystojenkinii]